MTDINSYLTKLSKQISNSKEEKDEIDTSILYLKGKIWERFQERLQSVEVFGSYERGTELKQSVDKKSDVDILVIFRSKEYQPETFLKHLSEFADNLYKRSDVAPDFPAITIELEHIRFELVPAYWETYIIDEDELKIPAPRNKELKWIPTEAIRLKNDLLEKEKTEKGMMIPMIKLIKYFNTLQGRPYDSYIIEKFALSRSYPCKNLRDYFFEIINDMVISGQTDEQKKFVSQLKAIRENLMWFEKRSMNDHIELELQKFLPLIC